MCERCVHWYILNVAGNRKSEGSVGNGTANTWLSHFQFGGKLLVNFGMLMQKQMSTLIASTVGGK